MPSFNIFGDIVANDGDRWFDSDVMPAMLIGWLAKQEGDVEININSNGGDVAAGLAIANALKGYKRGAVTCNVLGVAASMASVIACAGKRLCMGEGAFLMIHNPWTVTMGNAEDLRKDAETLDKMRDSILSFYLEKCPGKTPDDFKELMDAETWISRTEAKEMGFAVSDYEGEFRAAASLTRRAFGNAPDSVRAMLSYKAEKPAAEPSAPEKAKTPAPDAPSVPEGENAAPAAPHADDEPPHENPAAPHADNEPPHEPEKPAPADNWEARFKGLSAKFNDFQRRAAADLAARDAEKDTLKSQLETSAKDLVGANAKISTLSAKLEEANAALQTAQKDLAETRDSLKAAEDKAAELVKTRDLLTAGVLSPAPESTYADKMKAAKTPEEREALRAQKRAGKIK